MKKNTIDLKQENIKLEKIGLGYLKIDDYTLEDIDFIKYILDYSSLTDKENITLFNDICLKMTARIIDDCNKWYKEDNYNNLMVDFVDKVKYGEIKKFSNKDKEKIIFLNKLSDKIKKEILLFKYNSNKFVSTMYFDITKLISDTIEETGLDNFNYLNQNKIKSCLDIKFVNAFFNNEKAKRKIKCM